MESVLAFDFGSWRLAWPWAFAALLLPWLLRRQADPAGQRVGALRLPFGDNFPVAVPPSAGRRFGTLNSFAFALLVFAAARPQWVDPADRRPASGRDLLLVLDVSPSMKTVDLAGPRGNWSRHAAATRLGRAFLERRPGDRVGLIVFASRPYLYVPLTYDLQAVGAALDAAPPGFAGERTALGDALALSVRTLAGESGELGAPATGETTGRAAAHQVAVLISDGANTAGTVTPEQAAWIAARRGVRVHALMVGGAAEPPTLRAIAEQTAGSYARATDLRGAERFFEQLARLEPAAGDPLPPAGAWRELYAAPLGLAVALLALGALPLSPGRRSKPSVAERPPAGQFAVATPVFPGKGSRGDPREVR